MLTRKNKDFSARGCRYKFRCCVFGHSHLILICIQKILPFLQIKHLYLQMLPFVCRLFFSILFFWPLFKTFLSDDALKTPPYLHLPLTRVTPPILFPGCSYIFFFMNRPPIKGLHEHTVSKHHLITFISPLKSVLSSSF